MSLGIDIHPYYQRNVTSWATVRNQGVQWVYVKASDGNAPYSKQVGSVVYRPDTHVYGARSVGLPVGAYHYAQFGDPVQQANVLIGEDQRLGTNLPPMLDLEAPFSPNNTARNFAIAFLNRLAQAGHRPVLYLSSSNARILRPDLWNIGGLIIWIASYGPNNGVQNPLTGGYPGRVDIHQYTSVGRVAGINADVDLNQAYVAMEEEDVPLRTELFEFRTPEGQLLRVDALTAIANLYAERFYGSTTAPWTGPSGRALDQASAAQAVAELNDTELAEELAAQGVADVSPALVKEAVRAAIVKFRAPTNGDATSALAEPGVDQERLD